MTYWLKHYIGSEYNLHLSRVIFHGIGCGYPTIGTNHWGLVPMELGMSVPPMAKPHNSAKLCSYFLRPKSVFDKRHMTKCRRSKRRTPWRHRAVEKCGIKESLLLWAENKLKSSSKIRNVWKSSIDTMWAQLPRNLFSLMQHLLFDAVSWSSSKIQGFYT